MPEPKPINFTIVPDDPEGTPRIYSNFCAIAHTPFDLTLTFCEVLPLSEKDLREAETEHTVHAPVRASIVIPLPMVPNLVAALQEHLRAFGDQQPGGGWGKNPVH
ncbi:MAG TPA: DUF3467 domain-containing protein [Vicinamibacterales bacterium]|nr:DUF3467 domain-containing protein [Vicinamibacterales bacterium]